MGLRISYPAQSSSYRSFQLQFLVKPQRSPRHQAVLAEVPAVTDLTMLPTVWKKLIWQLLGSTGKEISHQQPNIPMPSLHRCVHMLGSLRHAPRS